MFRSVKKAESQICVDLEEPLTGQACAQLFIEIVKYIIYQKQQIPLACDSLIKLHANSKPTDKNFTSMQNLIKALCNVSDNLESQFNLDGCDIKEIVIMIGATVVSPKLCIRMEIPSYLLNNNTHLEYQHSYRKPLLNVMRSILKCDSFQDAMTVPLGPTNTFVLIQKRDPYKTSEFFLPKPHYTLVSQNTTCFRIRLNYSENNQLNCNCSSLVKIYQDSSNIPYTEENPNVEKENMCTSEVPYLWYQSKEVLKGFKFLR